MIEFIAVCSKYSRNVDLMTSGNIKNMILDNFTQVRFHLKFCLTFQGPYA